VNEDLFFLWFVNLYFLCPRETGFQFCHGLWNVHLLMCDLWIIDYWHVQQKGQHLCSRKVRGDKCCPGPKSCLPCVRLLLRASVSEWHIRPWDGCHRAQRQGDVCLCQAPGGMVARGSGCAHLLSPKLKQPRHCFNVGLKGCRQQHLSPKPFIKEKNNN